MFRISAEILFLAVRDLADIKKSVFSIGLNAHNSPKTDFSPPLWAIKMGKSAKFLYWGFKDCSLTDGDDKSHGYISLAVSQPIQFKILTRLQAK